VEAVRTRFLIALAGVVLLACAEFADPGSFVSFIIAPNFGNNAV